MTDGWIKQEAESILRADVNRQQQALLKSSGANALQEKSSIFFAASIQAVRAAVAQFNEVFAGNPKRQLALFEGRDTVGVGALNSVSDATLDGNIVRVQTTSGHAAIQGSSESLLLAVDERENVYVASGAERGPQAVARAVLRQFMTAFREDR